MDKKYNHMEQMVDERRHQNEEKERECDGYGSKRMEATKKLWEQKNGGGKREIPAAPFFHFCKSRLNSVFSNFCGF